MTIDTPMLAAALQYAKAGWSVLPCRPRTKIPLTKHGLKDATNDIDQIKRWWQGEPNANIAIRCGIASSGLVVVDVDGPEGEESLKGKSLPPTAIAKTGGGGWHYFYRSTARIRPKVGVLPKVDIRAEDSYVVVPPSIHPSGATYDWQMTPKDAGLHDLPEWVIEAMVVPELPQSNGQAPKPGEIDKRKVGRAALQFVADGAPKGQQRLAAVAAARNLLSAGYSVDATAHKLWQGFQACEQDAEQPWTLVDARKIAQDIADKPAPPMREMAYQYNNPANGRTPMIITTSAIDLMRKEFPPVKFLIPRIWPEGMSLLAAKPKIGKAQPVDTPVLTPAGWRPMGTLQVGDEVIGADGQATTVTAIYPQGTMQCYRVEMSDGSFTEATGEHLWRVWSQTQRFNRTKGRLMTTEEISKYLAAGQSRVAYLPMTMPVTFTKDESLPFDPYLLGLLLGDGSLTKSISFNSRDVELFNEIHNRLPEGMTTKLFPNGHDISLRKARRTPSVKSSLQVELENLSLFGLKSEHKFIPDAYKFASVSNRLAILRGLMDTDGWNQSNSVQFCTVSERLASDVQFLAESLGGCASVKKKEKTGYQGQNGFVRCRPAYLVTFRLPEAVGCPFQLARKATAWHNHKSVNRRPPTRRIISVTPSRATEAQCISVAANDGLYLTEHCIVTHNTWLSLGIATAIAFGGVALGTAKVEEGEVLYLALEDGERRIQGRLRAMLLDQEPPPNLHFAYSWPRVSEGGVEALAEWMQTHPRTRLIVVDTLRKLRPVERVGASSYNQDYDAISPLTELSHEYNVSVWGVSHLRKMVADDPLEQVSGTMGLTGAADHIFVLKRERTQAQAILYVMSRDIPEEELALEWQPPHWVLVGTAKEAKQSAERKEIIEVMQKLGHPSSPKEIADTLGRNAATIRGLLSRMNMDGIVVSDGRGKYEVFPRQYGDIGQQGQRGQLPQQGQQGQQLDRVEVLTCLGVDPVDLYGQKKEQKASVQVGQQGQRAQLPQRGQQHQQGQQQKVVDAEAVCFCGLPVYEYGADGAPYCEQHVPIPPEEMQL